MSEVQNRHLSPEGQHVVNSLEAHHAAITRLVANASPEAQKAAAEHAANVAKALDAWGAKFARKPEAEGETAGAAAGIGGAAGKGGTVGAAGKAAA